MIENINNNQVPDILRESSLRQLGASKNSGETGVDASLQVSYESLIEQAKLQPQEDDNAVQEARELLLSGQLDSPENIRAAAEAFVKFGV